MGVGGHKTSGPVKLLIENQRDYKINQELAILPSERFALLTWVSA